MSQSRKSPNSRIPDLFLACRLVSGGSLLLLAGSLAACAGRQPGNAEGGNSVPADYKSDVMAAVRSYVNNPRRIRDAAISEPMLKSMGRSERYVVCVRFNARDMDGKYTGVKARIAIFSRGKLDQFMEAVTDGTGPRQGQIFSDEAPTDRCAGVVYQPFPELEKLETP